ncbi:hypothetical protein SAMN06265222_12167 [Neorhodopirellula lusitana]|uniref:Uncharacterized protein n=1 Tax=Neorhodopirellula lusitana TaxID=445327 RepID=A0ABY1QNV3_9BACT|nr:hypothetical protein SAMN06265222_12167 [Neorhodopirellula lusitana]
MYFQTVPMPHFKPHRHGIAGLDCQRQQFSPPSQPGKQATYPGNEWGSNCSSNDAVPNLGPMYGPPRPKPNVTAPT